MMEKMHLGQVVPKLIHKECLTLMYEVLSDPDLHRHASEGCKKLGQSVDLHGKEDVQVVREAGTYWNEPTSDGAYVNMRPTNQRRNGRSRGRFR